MTDTQAKVAELQRRIQDLERENQRMMREVTAHFQERSEFKRLITQIATRFVQMKMEEVDRGIEQALADVGQFVGCDRSFLCQYHNGRSLVDNTHDWCAPGIPSLKAYFQNYSTEGMDWFTSQMEAGQVVQIDSTSELGEEAGPLRQVLEEFGVGSLLCVPLHSGGELRGFVGFVFASRHYVWPQEQVDLLRIVGEALLSALDRRQYEQTLRSSEEMFRILAANVPGVVYTCRNDDRYTILYLNDRIDELTGYSADDFLENRISFVDLYHPDDRDMLIAEANRCLAAGQPFQLEYRLKHRDGTWRWVEERGQAVHAADGQILFLEGTIFDISERKRVQEQLQTHRDLLEIRVKQRTHDLETANEQLKRENAIRRAAEQALRTEQQLLRSTLEQHENDRKLVAFEIHDGLAQYLTAASMYAGALKNLGDPNLENQAELIRQMLRRSLDETRRLISGLRPPILDEEGIVPALKNLVDEREPAIGKIHFKHDVRFDRLTPLLESAIYRITQEALNNVIKHSGAKEVFIELTQEADDQIRLSVRDRGRGFDPESITEKSYGLRGVRERAHILGGEAQIITAPGKGTEVLVTLPIHERL